MCGIIALKCHKLVSFFFEGGNGGLMGKVFASQPRDRGFEPNTVYSHDSSYGASSGWFQEVT